METRWRSGFVAAALAAWLALAGCKADPQALPTAVSLAAAATTAAATESSLSGDIRYHRGFPAAALGNTRDLIVYLPPGYKADPGRRYPVLYMHDGNNIFDRATAFGGLEWGADETAQRLISQQAIAPLIIVGIYNTPARIEEYTWTPMVLNGKRQGGDGPKYAQFMIKELKPFIDRTYRTQPDRDHTGVAGSSLGGLISFYLGRNYPNVFGRIGVLSPSLWWDGRAAFRELDGFPRNLRVWLDIGTREGGDEPDNSPLNDARDMHRALQAAGYRDGGDLLYFEDVGGQHNEYFWGRRFDKVLEFLFPPDDAAQVRRAA